MIYKLPNNVTEVQLEIIVSSYYSNARRVKMIDRNTQLIVFEGVVGQHMLSEVTFKIRQDVVELIV